MTVQIISPNPNIPCKPGWCLAYVNEAFGVRKVYGSATAAWNGSTTQHRDRNFPAGVWIPVWYGLNANENGHVVLRAPNGSVYSTSDLTTTPHHHPDLADLEAYYAYYGMTLTYRGWTEDVEGTPVIALGDSIGYQGDIINSAQAVQEDDDMSAEEVETIRKDIATVHQSVLDGTDTVKAYVSTVHNTIIRDVGGQLGALRELVTQLATKQGVDIDYAKVEDAVKAALANGITVDVTVNGAKTSG